MRVIAGAAVIARAIGQHVVQVARTRGPGSLARDCVCNATRLPERIGALLAEAAFDHRTGCQTSPLIAAADLGVDQTTLDGIAVNRNGDAYMPTPAWAFGAMLPDLDIAYPEFTFIDLGSGMGRAVLKAAELPFAKVIGIELSPDLHRIAIENLRRCEHNRRAAIVELLLEDAREFAFPSSNCVVYMFNPFQEPALRIVLDNLRSAFASRTNDLYLIYFNPILEHLLDAEDFLTKYRRTRHYSVHRNR